jgi:protein-disulfide isomerase
VRVGPTLEQILTDYPKDVRVVYKMHPLPMHKNAMIAAEAALAAGAQGKFFEMNQKLLENSASLSRDKILALAGALGLDVKRFTNDLDTHAFKAAIDADTKEAMGAGATGTPASFINGRFLNGAAPIASFKKLVDEELAKATK